MNTSYGLNAYRAHDLNISMRTSSGDVIEMDFANRQSTSISYEQDGSSTSLNASFSSMQSFQFSVDSNGIDAQDKKEIEEFMKIAQPFIDDFLKEFEESAPKSPVSRLAHEIAGIFQPQTERNENALNHVKTNVVEVFDKAMDKLKLPEKPEAHFSLDKIFKEAQKLLEKTLKEFDDFNKNVYA